MTIIQGALRRLTGASSEQQAAAAPRGIYLIGDTGNPNFGDDLITREWLRFLAAEYPSTQLFVDSPWPGQAAARLHRENPHAHFVDTLARLSLENVHFDGNPAAADVKQIGSFIAGALDEEGRAARLASGIRVLRDEVSHIHFMGGGYITGKWLEKTARLSVVPWAHARGMKCAATGMGFVPIDGPALEMLESAAPCFDVLTVRDEESSKLLASVRELPVMPDDCFVNGLEGIYMQGAELPDVMVCVQSDFTKDTQALYDHVLAILDAWGVEPGTRIGVVECYPYLDYPIFESIRDAGYDAVFFPAANLLTDGFPAREGQRWITTRYHPHLLAAYAGASGTYVTVGSTYYDVKHNAVLRMGSNWTHSVLGKSIAESGPGVADRNMAIVYKKSIRASVRDFYNA